MLKHQFDPFWFNYHPIPTSPSPHLGSRVRRHRLWYVQYRVRLSVAIAGVAAGGAREVHFGPSGARFGSGSWGGETGIFWAVANIRCRKRHPWLKEQNILFPRQNWEFPAHVPNNLNAGNEEKTTLVFRYGSNDVATRPPKTYRNIWANSNWSSNHQFRRGGFQSELTYAV